MGIPRNVLGRIFLGALLCLLPHAFEGHPMTLPGHRVFPRTVISRVEGPLVTGRFAAWKNIPLIFRHPFSKDVLRENCKSRKGLSTLLSSALAVNSRLREQYHNKSIVFVGSSHSLSGQGLGRRIDAFDVVVRMNGAPTAGFENDVGSKTTHRCMNSVKGGCNATLVCDDAMSSSFWELNRGVKLMPVSHTQLPEFIQQLHWESRPVVTEKIECFGHCPQVLGKWTEEAALKVPALRPQGLKGRVLRAGLCCLFAFLSAGLNPTLAGFDLTCVPNTVPEHYYSPLPLNACQGADTHVHDFYGELRVLRNWADAGLVAMLPA